VKFGRNIFSIQRAIQAQMRLAANTPPPPVKRSGCLLLRRLKAVIDIKGLMTKY
jgi:hypothetical protein